MSFVSDDKFNLFINSIEQYIKQKNPVEVDQNIIKDITDNHLDTIKRIFFYCVRSNSASSDQYFNQLFETENTNIRVDLTNRYKNWSLVIHSMIDETSGDIRSLVKKHHHEGYRYFELTSNGEEAVFRFVNFDEHATVYGGEKPSDVIDTISSINYVDQVFTYVKSACLINGLHSPCRFDVGYFDDEFIIDLFLAGQYMLSSGLQTQHTKNMYQLNNKNNNYGNLDETLSEQRTVYYAPSKSPNDSVVDVEFKLQLLYKNKKTGYSISSHCNVSVSVILNKGIPYWVSRCSVQPSTGYTMYIDC